MIQIPAPGGAYHRAAKQMERPRYSFGERRCWACYVFVPHVLMIAPRDGHAIILSQTTNSFRSHQLFILFFSQRTRLECGMTHNDFYVTKESQQGLPARRWALQRTGSCSPKALS